MTEEQKAAYINAMATGALIEAMGMVAENKYREQRGDTIAYTEEAFQEVIQRWGIHHNSVIDFMRD